VAQRVALIAELLVVCWEDAELVDDLESFKYSGVNLTAFRLVNLRRPAAAKLLRRWSKRKSSSSSSPDATPLENHRGFRVRLQQLVM